MRFDVVIVGAGIGGAVLALDLGRRGWRVALVERESAPPRIARPEILWGATLRALEPYGVAEAVRHTASVQLEGIEIGAEKPWLRITRDDFATAGVDAFSTNPSMTRTIIAGAAVATGNVDIHRGVAVEDLRYDDGRVTSVQAKRGDATLVLKARLVVGDDGGSSVVRTHLGIPITLDTFPIEFVTAIIPRWPLPPHRVRGWIHPKGFGDGLSAAVFLPWPGNEGVLLVPLPADRAKRLFGQPPEIFWSALERVTPMAGALHEQLEFPRDFWRVARSFGHVRSYVANGAALIGDAAHPMTPAGGQGANASIWDALALADVADAALRTGDVSRERLLPYERWLAGLRDGVVGRVLRLFHSRPGHPWTLDELARESASSRSNVAKQFAELVGQPPMQYLTQWRMQVAANLLTQSGAKVHTIGAKVGYDSEAAFSRAFKKATGLAPGAWREARRTAQS